MLGVSCAQLTDNVTQATAGAVQLLLASCRSGILRMNNRSDDEAINATMHRDDVFALNRSPPEEVRCDWCLPAMSDQQGTCCCNGGCDNGVCQCNEGQCS